MNIEFPVVANFGKSAHKRPPHALNIRLTQPQPRLPQAVNTDVFIRQNKPASALKFKGFSSNDDPLVQKFSPEFQKVIQKAHDEAINTGGDTLTAEHLIRAIITTLNDATNGSIPQTRAIQEFSTQLANALRPDANMEPAAVASQFMPLANALQKTISTPRTQNLKIQRNLCTALKQAGNSSIDSNRQITHLVNSILWSNPPSSSAFYAIAQQAQNLRDHKKRELHTNSDSDAVMMDVEVSSNPYDMLKLKSPMLAKWVEAASEHGLQDFYDEFNPAPLPAVVSQGIEMALQELKTNRKNPVISSHNKNLASLNALIPWEQRKNRDTAHIIRVLENAHQKLQALPKPGNEAELAQASNTTKRVFEQFLAPSLRNDFSLSAFVQTLKDTGRVETNAFATSSDQVAVAQILSELLQEGQDKRLEHRELLERACPSLMRNGTNLVRAGMEGQLPNVLMRREATDRLLSIINSGSNRTNIMLNVASGEGKTFAVLGLAQRLANNEVPENLQGAQLIQLDMSQLNPSVFKELSTYLKQNSNRKVIVFMDEIHMLDGDEGKELVNLMKSSGILEQKNLTFIGATTPEDWRQSALRNDPAFQGRFHEVSLPSFSKAEKLSILGYNALDIEKNTGLEIPPELLEQALSQASAKWPENGLRRTIDALGLAASLTKGMPIEAATLQDRLQQKELWLKTLQGKKTLSGRFTRQMQQTAKEMSNLTTQLQQMDLKSSSTNQEGTVTEKHLRQAMAILTGERIGTLGQDELSKIRNAQEVLSRSIVGQPEALSVISEGLRKMVVRQKTGDVKDHRPVLSMLLCGPTGVGKTEVSKVIAKEFMDGNLIRLDMSDYGQEHNISLLKGAPPGYVGYENGGLVDQVRQKPNSVIVFDEIEKAHPDIFNVLLPILEEGELLDNQGKPVSFHNAIIALTSNLNNEQLTQLIREHRKSTQQTKDSQLASRELEKQVRQLLTANPSEDRPGFRPEQLGRINYVIPFSPLTQSHVSDILDIRLHEMNQVATLQDNNLEVSLSPDARARLVELSAASGKASYARAARGEKKEEVPLQSGARDVRDIFDRFVYNKVFDALTFEFSNLENAKLTADYDPASQSFMLQPETLMQEPQTHGWQMVFSKHL